MRYILNFYNQVAAGPIILTKTFLDILFFEIKDNQAEFRIILPKIPSYINLNLEREKQKNLKIFYLPYCRGFGKLLLLFLYHFFVFPLMVLLFRPRAILIFGDFAPLPLISKKIVLMHHSYLVDDELFTNLNFGTKFIESVKRIMFFFTVRTSKTIVVETGYMKRKTAEKYNIPEKKIHVIKDPISKSLYGYRQEILKERENVLHTHRKFVLYISRYAPHKNYNFLLNLAKRYSNKFKDAGVKFYITVDPIISREAAEYIKKINLYHLNKIITNLGEIPHRRLKDYYKKALCLFFPSESESFGLPLIEAMAFKLPIVAPALPYAYSICEDAALYYMHNDIDDAFRKIWELSQNKSLWEEYSNKSIQQFNKYPTAEEWVERYLNLLKN